MNKKQAFEANDNEQLTVRNLVNIISRFLSDSEEPVYRQFYMKKLVKERFGDGVVIAETERKASVVTLRPMQPNDSDKKNEYY